MATTQTQKLEAFKIAHGFTPAGAVADAAAATATAMPAGGTGAAAGGWDTAANRDLAIAAFAALLDDVAAIRTQLNAALAQLRTNGLIDT